MLGCPSPDTPRPRDPHFVWPGATRRCFAQLGLSRRDAMRLCGQRLGSVGVGVEEYECVLCACVDLSSDVASVPYNAALL